MQLTKEKLLEIRKLCDAATPGPWNVMYGRSLVHIETDISNSVAGAGRAICSIPTTLAKTAQFIAAADPDTVRALLDRIDELEKAVKP